MTSQSAYKTASLPQGGLPSMGRVEAAMKAAAAVLMFVCFVYFVLWGEGAWEVTVLMEDPVPGEYTAIVEVDTVSDFPVRSSCTGSCPLNKRRAGNLGLTAEFLYDDGLHISVKSHAGFSSQLQVILEGCEGGSISTPLPPSPPIIRSSICPLTPPRDSPWLATITDCNVHHTLYLPPYDLQEIDHLLLHASIHSHQRSTDVTQGLPASVTTVTYRIPLSGLPM